MGTPPVFLQEYDSMGVRGWGCAKDVILWELVKRPGERRLTGDPSTPLRAGSLKSNGEKAKRWLARRGYPHPPVFFVRVANKGLMLDAASRASTFGELNTETPRPGRGKRRAQRSEMGTDSEVRAGGRARLAAIMGNDSTKVTDCQ
jgi:hypothetical protein